jgi:hypothetical protein
VESTNIILFGMGMATLIPTNGNSAIIVDNVDGVRISGLILQAGNQYSDSLLSFGISGANYPGNPTNPGILYDVFARVGGPDHDPVSAGTMIRINSGNVITDNVWLWRADHDIDDSPVHNRKNPVDTAL